MEEKIRLLISELKEDPSFSDKLTDSSSIIDDVGFDSLQMINFILKLEDEFDIEIDFEEFDMEHMGSIKKLASYIRTKS